jgi:hypothetical protein
MMSDHMLHIIGATRTSNCSTIVGDRPALVALRSALDDALRSGSGGTFLSTSDGEHHAVAIVLTGDMYPVFTTYAGENNPARSKRETIPVNKLLNYQAAIAKAHEMEAAAP